MKNRKVLLKTGICALGIVVIVLSIVSCDQIAAPELKPQDGNAGIVWKGEAESHDDALAKWGEPQYDWMYFNTTDKSIYRHNGAVWVPVVEGAALHGEGVVWKGEAESPQENWGTPQKGWMYFNTTDQSIYQFDGENWELVAEGPLPAVPGDSIVWKGEAESPQENWGTPQKGWMYFNTTDQSIYQFDGENWELVVEGPLPADLSIVWKGDAESHDDAIANWGTPQKDWMYFNTTNKSIYRHNGEDWALVVIVGDGTGISAVPVGAGQKTG